MTQQAMQRQEPQSLKALLKDSLYQKRFEEILGKRAPQFVSSVLSVGTSLGADCEPTSIIASAMTAATLDLPVDKNLGFAWIVPYKHQGKKSAQFQMGYKGYIQLGLRTGQYERMNARVINAEAFQGWDEVGEPIIDWSQIDESKPSIGYVFAFKLVNGFTKIAYWPKERIETHAKRYSQSYKGKFSSPWETNFDAMALKTVVKNELSKWGILSIEMVTAIKHDQGTQDTLDAELNYPDGTDINGNGGGDNTPAAPAVISEEQRTALYDLAKEHGVVEKLGPIVSGLGFEMTAYVTVDRYDEVANAIKAAANTVDAPAVDDSGSGSETEQNDNSDLDPETETIRAHVQELFDGLTKNQQKELLVGKPSIGASNLDQIEALKDSIEGLSS